MQWLQKLLIIFRRTGSAIDGCSKPPHLLQALTVLLFPFESAHLQGEDGEFSKLLSC